MKYFSASYIYTKSNFALIGCEQFGDVENDWHSMACVVENIIQRGTPTIPSERLRMLLGEAPRPGVDRPVRPLVTHRHRWRSTVKGASDGSNPALFFFEHLLPSALPPEKHWIVNYILPEAFISDIVPDCDPRYADQRVDFYCPRANLAIEIDGSQHRDVAQSYLDRDRELYLELVGVDTVRVPVDALDARETANILVSKFDEGRTLDSQIDEKSVFAYEIALRAQIALVELVKRGALSPSDPTWGVHLRCDQPWLDAAALLKAAAEDLFDLFEGLCALAGREFVRPDVAAPHDDPGICLDVSATKMWSDLESGEGVVYVRNDYYEERDNFTVSCDSPIAYASNETDRRDVVDDVLRFFLKYLFGYSEFRPGQAGIIRKALSRQATLGILPTGSGKSLCYQMACLLQPCVSFVVCPIISLIQDQESNARELGICRVGRIESQMAAEEKSRALGEFGRGKFFFVWVSPERFQMASFRCQLSEIARRMHFGYSVIDEVHCLSEWGHDFRVSYLKLHDTIKSFCPEAVTLALTATASRNVLEDLLCELEISKSNVQTSPSLDRPELTYRIRRTTEESREQSLDDILDEIDKTFQAREGVGSVFEARGSDSLCGIVFSNTVGANRPTISNCEGVLSHLRARGIPADSYHAQRGDERSRVQYEYLNNEFTVMAATKAFGMGVNKKNVRYTVHNGLPWSIEAFYQEAGRAGRDPDKNASECYILYSNESNPDDVKTLFAEQTTAAEIRDIQSRLSGDLETLFYLWCGNHEDADIERSAIVETFKELYRLRDPEGHAIIRSDFVKKATWDAVLDRMKRAGGAAKAELHVSTEDALYKLAILGIVKDWTVEYGKNALDVEVSEIDSDSEASVRGALESYIRRHSPSFSLSSPSPAHRKYADIYANAPKRNKLIGLIDVLIAWTNDNIVFNRRRSIGNMLELCESGRDEQGVREYIDSYFRLDTESNDQLDVIVGDTDGIDSWFRLFLTYELTDDPSVQVDVLKPDSEIRSISALCDRYRESYHANIGLEWSTMMSRLLSNGFEDDDVSNLFEFVFAEAREYEKIDAEELLERSLDLLAHAGDEARDAFAGAIVEHMPDKADMAYEKLGDNVTLTYLLTGASARIEKTWGRIRRQW